MYICGLLTYTFTILEPDRKRNFLELFRLRSENELQDFMRELSNQTLVSPASPPPPSMTSSDQAVIGVDTSEIGEESDISDSVDII
jgi:hypothetical protein